MEILFMNKHMTGKLCMEVFTENIWDMNKREVEKLNEILVLNNGYTWKPVCNGFAYENNLPLIKA